MTSNSWAYPDGCTPYYPYDATGTKSKELAIAAGYSLNTSTGKLTNNKGETLKFTFTIAEIRKITRVCRHAECGGYPQ